MDEHIQRHMTSNKGSSNRSFGLIFATVFLIVSLLPLLHGGIVRYWALITSFIFAMLALLFPRVLAPLNRLWSKFGEVLHGIVSPVALAVLFYGVVLPTGLLMRLLGKDLLNLRLDPTAASYWQDRQPPGPDAESLKNQF